MFRLKDKKNYLKIIPVTRSDLELCTTQQNLQLDPDSSTHTVLESSLVQACS